MNDVIVGGQTLTYEVHGNGQPVLAVRNISQRPETWPGPFIDRITAAGYQVITFQHLGPRRGSLTDIASDVGCLVDQLALGTVRVWGYSGGAMLAQEFVLLRPDLVRSAIFTATAGRRSALLELSLESYEALARHQPELAAVFAYVTLVSSMSPALLGSDDLVRSTVAAMRDGEAYASEDAMQRWFAALHTFGDRLAAFAEITIPAMVISFERDLTMLAAEGRKVAKAIPDCKYVEVAGAAHDGMWTHTDIVIEHVIEFFASA